MNRGTTYTWKWKKDNSKGNKLGKSTGELKKEETNEKSDIKGKLSNKDYTIDKRI